MLRQLSWEEYGRHDYLPRAIVDVAVAEFERYHRVSFEADVDDLGEVLWCPVVLGSGAPVLLSRHIGTPDEVVVWGPDDFVPSPLSVWLRPGTSIQGLHLRRIVRIHGHFANTRSHLFRL